MRRSLLAGRARLLPSRDRSQRQWVLFPVVTLLVVALVERSPADEVVESSSPKRQIVLNVRLLEFDRAKLKRIPGEVDDQGRLVRLEKLLARDDQAETSEITNSVDSILAGQILPDVAALDAMLTVWRDQAKAVTIIAEPTVVAAEGEWGKFHRGGTVKFPAPEAMKPLQWEERSYGPSVYFRAQVGPQELIQFEAYCRRQHLDANLDHKLDHAVPGPDDTLSFYKYTIPGLVVDFEVNGAFELRSDQTILLARLGSGTEQLVLLSPTLVAHGVDVSHLATPSEVKESVVKLSV